ncbi:MAG TPA: YdcF family protein [Ktedonobacteraceae bacterium]|jgi:uncharacterized SAM-binding protein YcdF (DUF218 family)|nr:YdcF family protein [Ktedonobacteraceae bacterium]
MKKKIIITLSVVVAVFVLVYGTLVVYVFHMAKQDAPVKSDAAVVLGEAAMGGTSCYGPRCKNRVVSNPHYNVCLESRINQAVYLYKNHYIPKILMSGGTDKNDNVNEAETMKAIAIKDGIPGVDILMEKESTSTYQNLAFSQKILNKAGLHSAIIVTDPSTNARAGFVASKLHYSYSLSPDMSSPCSHLNDYIFREPLAIIYYFLSGKI